VRRRFIFTIIFLLTFAFSSAWGQKPVRLSVATGGVGGINYPLGETMARVLSKYIPYVEVTPEVTTTSVDNCLLVGMGKADLALVVADLAWDAYRGKSPFKEKAPLRTVGVLYPNNMHVVSAEGKGIEKMTDLKGKRVSTGVPGSGTEMMALRVIKAFGLDPNKDLTRDKLSVSESAGALKDGKIDAFFWLGGLPTAAVTDLGLTPGVKMKLIGHADAVPKMREKYGPLYVKGVIPAKTYPGQGGDVPIAVIWNLLICAENMKGNTAYDILRTLFNHKPEIVAFHRELGNLLPEDQMGVGSPIPFHSGAIRYFTEKGLKIR
jgi:TRAP transporter TAXI family solute receptor